MPRTFLLTSPRPQDITLDALHVNLWSLSSNDLYIDIGMLMVVAFDHFPEILSELTVYSPFSIIPGSIASLHDTLRRDNVMQLIFNDDVTNVTSSLQPNSGLSIYRFASGRSFLLVPVATTLNQDNFGITLTFTAAPLDPTHKSTISHDGNKIAIYSRLRFKADVNQCLPNITIQNTIRERIYFYDFRFNEPRLIPNSPLLYDKVVIINNLYVFIIKEASYQLSLHMNSNFRYVRMLELGVDGWGKYIPEILGRNGLFLVYYWKKTESTSPNSPFDMIVAYKTERMDAVQLMISSLGLFIVSLLFLRSPEIMSLSGQIVALIHGIGWAFFVVAGIAAGNVGVVVVGVAANALWAWLASHNPRRR